MNGTAEKSSFYKKENGYESITMKGVTDENSDAIVWELNYTSHFDLNGNRIDIIFDEDGEASMKIENAYNSKNQKIITNEFFYGELTAKTTFEYDSKGLLQKQLIEVFPYKKLQERKKSPSDKPEMRVYEYEFYN